MTMYSVYELAQLFAAAGVLILALLANNYRGAGWIVALTIDLMVSTASWKAGYPYAAAVTGSADFLLCIAIYCFAMHRWEMWVFLLYQFSMLVSIVYLGTQIWGGGLVIDHDAYSSVLEAVNYSALLIIAITSGMSLASTHRDSAAFRPWRWLRPAGFPLFR